MDRDDVAEEDLISIGLKVVEMADRAKGMNAACSGVAAAWCFQMDDVRFRLKLSVIDTAD